MARKYIYGIISAREPLAFGVSAFPGTPQPVYGLAHHGLAAVVSDYSGGNFTSLAKEDQFRCLMAHQTVIERVMKGHTILPLKFGTLLESDDQVRRLLEQGHEKLGQALTPVEGKVEMEVAATWDLKQVLSEISRQEETVWLWLRQSIAQQPAAEALGLQVQAGRLVKESLDRRRDEYRERMVNFLRETALDVQPNALVTEEMVMNVAFLIPREREGDFDNQVRQLNGLFQDQVNFRIIGPLPAYSFSTVEVTRPSVDRVQEARQLLGLGTVVSEAEVKEAYRHLAARSHPDARPGDELAEKRFTQVREAATLLLNYCQGQSPDGKQGEAQRRYSLAPEEVSRAFLIRIKRSAAPVAGPTGAKAGHFS